MAEYIERAKVAEFFEKNKQAMWHKDDVAATVSSKNIPAADVVEVVQAAWTDKGFCTNCGHRAHIVCVGFNCTGGTRVTYERTPYCAGCGAKMDRKDDT